MPTHSTAPWQSAPPLQRSTPGAPPLCSPHPTRASLPSFGSAAAAIAADIDAQVVPSAPYNGASTKQAVDAGVVARPGIRSSDDAVMPAPEPAKAHTSPEQKHGDKLGRRFVALAEIVPGVRKRDRTAILGDVIRCVKQLQERVRVLEEEAQMWADGASVLVEESQHQQLHTTDDDVDEVSSCKRCNSLEGVEASRRRAAPPGIEVRMAERTVQVKVQCRNRKGAAIAALSELERIGLAIMTANVLPFAASLHITVVATSGEGFCLSVEDIVRTLSQALKLYL
ncbi:hypothetical protein ACP70R_021443 [Stipagrostis hirtigluma subsp. patula]